MKHFEIVHDDNGKFVGVLVSGKAYTLFNIGAIILSVLTFIIIT